MHHTTGGASQLRLVEGMLDAVAAAAAAAAAAALVLSGCCGWLLRLVSVALLLLLLLLLLPLASLLGPVENLTRRMPRSFHGNRVGGARRRGGAFKVELRGQK